MGICSSFGSLAAAAPREQKVMRELELVLSFSLKWAESSGFWDLGLETETREGSKKLLLVEGKTPWARDVEEERSELANAEVAMVEDWRV